MGLTVKRVARLTEPGRYFDSRGLYLVVESPTNRYWMLRYQLRDKERWMGLGSAAIFSLQQARQRRDDAHRLLADGIDPLEVRRAEQAKQAAAAAKDKTFGEVAAEFFAAHSASWTNRKHRDDFSASLKTHASKLNNLPVAVIDEPLVLDVLRPIWNAKTVTAKRVRQRIASVFDFAAAAGYRSGSNPARWEGHLQHLLGNPKKLTTTAHHAALAYAELPSFMEELRDIAGIPARALEFLILTAVRTGELVGAEWSEIDFATATWTVPAKRMKTRREHRVALSRQAVALLQALPRESPFVFIGFKAGASIGKDSMYRTLKSLRNISVHGFRSSFRTWSEERTSYPTVVAEQALAHTVGKAVERAYRRTDLFEQRARLMQQWSDFCDAPVAAAEITPLRRIRS
jgi:integrase